MAIVGTLLLFGLGAAAGIAYFTAGSGLSSTPQQIVASQHDGASPQDSAASNLARPPTQALVRRQPAPPNPAPSPAAPDPRTELVARVREEAKAQFDTYRNEIVSQCWPAAGLPKGAKSAKLTINVTFDAQGNEIARGISEDRRAPAGEFGRCVRNLPGTRLGVSPPGTNVAVSIPVSYP